MSYHCGDCGFKLFLPVARLGVSYLGLYDDHRYPGRCLLVLESHHEVLHQVDRDVLAAFWRDCATAATAIEAVAGTNRINTAVLGNTERHVHAHLIPRVGSDPVPTRPIWEDSRDVAPLDGDEVTRLVAALRREFAAAL